VFYSTNNEVQRMDADGSNIVTMYTAPASEVVQSPRVDATNGFVYFAVEGQIKKVPVNGGAPQTVVTGISQARGLALDVAAGYIYWVDGDTVTDHIARARLDGTGFEVIFDNSYNNGVSSGLTDLIVLPAQNKIIFSDELLTNVRTMNMDGTNVQTIYTSPAGLSPIALTLTTGDPSTPLQDCNGNGTGDAADIAGGAPDCNNNGVVDTCEASPCPARVFLLDQGSMVFNGQGRALGQPSQWQVFQPFIVDTSWNVGEIGIDAHVWNWVEPDDVIVKIYPHNSATQLPDETGPALATTTMKLRFSPWFESWTYAPLSVTLPQGTYWARFEASDPVNFGGSIHQGFNGLQSRSRGSSGNFTAPAAAIALRIVQSNGTGCGNSDFNGDGDFGTDQDIEAFFACLAGNCCATCWPGGSDFNGDGDFGTDADIESFFRVLAGGTC
jgi:hypothetical protein